MAKSITFSVKLNVDGKEQLVAATANVKNLREVVRSMDSPMQGLLKQFNSWGFAFQNISSAANGIASSLNSLTAESRSFGGAMAAANTMAGKSGEDFTNLKTQVAELSKTIPVARDQLANGLYQVISNGVPEDNWIEYLEKSAKASVGGIANLEEVVKVTSTVIKNYGLAWDDAGTIQDKIQLTAKNGVTSFEQMAQALPRVTANASTLGVSVDELMASFATLTGVSGNTAEVSTQLAAIFTALIKPSSEASKMAQQMGIQFDAAAIKAAGGMKNFLTQMNANVKNYAATSGMLEQEVYGKLFGSAESLRAITPLVGNLADKFEENVNAMAGSAGTIDGAFETMGNTGSAQLQKLNNALGEYTDKLQGSIGNLLPYMNFTSQMITTAASVGTLSSSVIKLGGYIKSASAVQAACAAVTSKLSVIMRIFSAALTGTAYSATAAKVAIKGLMICSGVGLAVAALTTIIEKLTGANENAAVSADLMASGEAKAANSVQDAYEGTLKSTYADLMEQYERLKAAWNGLKSEHEKAQWIKSNKSAFDELKIKVNSVADAESIFSKNTSAVVDAFTKRAEAAAYAAKLTSLYQKQIALLDKKNKTTKAIADDAKKGGRNAKEGDVVPESWRSERYGKVGNDGQWRFTKAGAERYNGTNTSGNQQVSAIDKEIAQVDKDIASTKGQMANAAKSGGWVTAGAASPSAAGTSGGGSRYAAATTTTTNTPAPAPATGSIDWYEKAIDDKRKELNATADAATAKALNAEMEGLQRSLYMLKVKVGIETPPGSDIQNEIKPLTETVIESFEDMQERIRKNPIHVETDPEGLEKMKRKMEDLENVQMLGGTNIQSFESVRQSIESINSITDPTVKGFAAAGEACSTLGSAMQQLGADSEVAKAGMVLAAIGNIVLSFAQALTSCKTWVEWLAFGISGTAQMISLVATVSGFAKGGVVGGSSNTGDKIPVRVNSGEMILTKTQQAHLFALANGDERPKMTLPDYSLPKLTLNTAVLGALNRQSTESQTVKFRLEGRSLVGALANETRVNSRSGRRSNIVI